jgi:ABC-type polysaccharide/polyol phosphate transport system ATPase subunit
MNEKAIIVNSLSKEYFKKGPYARFKGKNEKILVLDNINLEINTGETVGIIGPNGAGKTTLLKIISEIVPPSDGTVEVFGKVVSILQVGIGFQPDLTGYENIFLAGSLYDLAKNKIKNKLDDIVEMFGFPEFLQTPVKYYSSGMYMRLAFAVITHIESDIYLFDEILGVGDLNFRNKVFLKIQEFKKQRKTILVITHAAQSIIKLFDRVLLLDNGKINFFGSPDAAIRLDYELLTNNNKFASQQKWTLNQEELQTHQNIFNLDFESKILLKHLNIHNVDRAGMLYHDQEITIETVCLISCEIDFRIGFIIKDYNDNVISSIFTEVYSTVTDKSEYDVSAIFPANTFTSNFFIVDVVIISKNSILMSYTHALKFRLESLNKQNLFEMFGYVNPIVSFEIK